MLINPESRDLFLGTLAFIINNYQMTLWRFTIIHHCGDATNHEILGLISRSGDGTYQCWTPESELLEFMESRNSR